jgi:hypothetical protein
VDPEENLKEQARVSRQIVAMLAEAEFAPGALFVARAGRLAELVLAMDEWAERGGFRPAGYRHDAKRSRAAAFIVKSLDKARFEPGPLFVGSAEAAAKPAAG